MNMLAVYTLLACSDIGSVLESGVYKNFPEKPLSGIEEDPGELDDWDKTGEIFWEWLQNWKKLKKEGKVGNQTMREAYKEYERVYGSSAPNPWAKNRGRSKH